MGKICNGDTITNGFISSTDNKIYKMAAMATILAITIMNFTKAQL